MPRRHGRDISGGDDIDYNYDAHSSVLQQFDYTLDAAGRRARIDELGGRYTEYVYDAVGNRSSSTIAGVTVSYSNDANGRLTSDRNWLYQYHVHIQLVQ
ncbi:MAG: hypothetical protein Tsb002_19740 [Wenzhouxiangellaceae bacterium]